MVKGLAAYARGQWPESLKLTDQSARLFRDRGSGMTISVELADYYSLRCLCWLGDFVELRRRRRALLKEAEQRENLFALTNYRTEVMSFDLLADDDPAGARHEIEDAMKEWPGREFHAQHLFALAGNLRIDLYRGDGARARRRIAEAWGEYRRSQLHRSSIGRVNVNLLIASSALASWGDERQRVALGREASAAAGRLDRERLDYARALAAMLRGRIASLRGEHEAAIRLYNTAIANSRLSRCRSSRRRPSIAGVSWPRARKVPVGSTRRSSGAGRSRSRIRMRSCAWRCRRPGACERYQ